jgi:choline-sulfatase
LAQRPNILFLMSDEHRPDVLGYAGDPVVRTPTLDRLARSGVVFDNAYTPSPICIPGRQAMMSGQLPSTCGCLRFGDDLAPGHMTFARRLSQYAYATVAAGKLHHCGTDQMQGWTHRLGNDVSVTPRYIPGRDDASYAALDNEDGTGKWSDTKEVLRAGVGTGPGHIADAYSLQGALNFVDSYFGDPWFDRPGGSRPLLLKLSLRQPHYPYFTDEARFTYYLNRVEPFLDQQVPDHPFLSRRQVRPGVDASPRELRRATAAYYGMIECIDDMYGQLLDRLAHHGQNIDDWIVIYTSDHGEMLGEHGIREKQKFYEASARVPLFIRWPARFDGARVVGENVNLCDLFATICELADVPVPDGLDSRSLVPLLDGETADWDNETISQFTHRATNVMIKRDQLKYQYYPDMPEVLFDLAADPGERVNCVGDPAYAAAVASFRQRLAALGHGPDADPDYINAGY